MLKSMFMMDPANDVPSWEELNGNIAHETWKSARSAQNPFYLLGGSLLFLWFCSFDLESWACNVNEAMPISARPWLDRMRQVSETFARDDAYNRLIHICSELGIPIDAAIIKLFASDFGECYQVDVDTRIEWTELLHFRSVTYFREALHKSQIHSELE